MEPITVTIIIIVIVIISVITSSMHYLYQRHHFFVNQSVRYETSVPVSCAVNISLSHNTTVRLMLALSHISVYIFHTLASSFRCKMSFPIDFCSQLQGTLKIASLNLAMMGELYVFNFVCCFLQSLIHFIVRF